MDKELHGWIYNYCPTRHYNGRWVAVKDGIKLIASTERGLRDMIEVQHLYAEFIKG